MEIARFEDQQSKPPTMYGIITITEVEAVARVSYSTKTTVASISIGAFRVFGASMFPLALVDVYSETMKSLSVYMSF